MLEKLNREIEELEEARRKAEKDIKEAPAGRLRCALNKGYFQYYQGKEYLGSDKKDLIQKLAQREYCERIKKKLRFT